MRQEINFLRRCDENRLRMAVRCLTLGLAFTCGCQSLAAPRCGHGSADQAAAAAKPPAADAPQPSESPKSALSSTQESGAVGETAVQNYAIDLNRALAIAGVENPTIGLAEEQVQSSLASLLEARSLVLPTLNAGTSFNWHDGNLLSARGIIRDVDRRSLYAGFGAHAIGTGTVTVPGANVIAQVADAVFAPRVARAVVVGRQFDALATRNEVLLDVATHYFALLGAEARLAAVRQSQKELDAVVQLTANFARTGLGREGDAERARTQAALLQADEQSAAEAVAVAAAELARLLSMDPSLGLHGPGAPLPIFQLIDPTEDLENLVQVAVANRPEVSARSADVTANAMRLKQEQVRPFVPLVILGYSAGDFGGGSNQADSNFGHFDGRTDFDAMAVWSLQNLGFGNRAIQRRVRAQVYEAEAKRTAVIDRIRREVADARAECLARRQEIEIGRRRAAIALEGYQLDLIRTRNLQARPIEVLNSVTSLYAARQDLIGALVEYSSAQFRLYAALGNPMSSASLAAAPGLPE
jgi:outer membrane protein TolC